MKLRCSMMVLLYLMMWFNCNGCSPVNNALGKSFKTLLPIDDLNRSIVLKLDPRKDNPLKIGENIYLIIENTSDNSVIFPVGFGIKIYVINDDRWLALENRVNFLGDEISLIPGVVDSVWFQVDPLFNDRKDREFIRIVVSGEFLIDGNKSGIPVAAFIDLTLKK